MRVVVTGGAGYIGSHAALRLLARGDEALIIDDLRRGHAGAVRALERLAPGRVRFERLDVRDAAAVHAAVAGMRADAVLHVAALAYVRESVERALEYYDVNVGGTASVVRAAVEAGVERFVLSSSCAVYGAPHPVLIPIDESCPLSPINPYGASKAFAERVLQDGAAGVPMRWMALRYFNVAGADPEGVLGEDHRPETHLIPLALQCALGKRPHVEVLGDDFGTPDGTCVRDFIHVEEVVDAHLRALDALAEPGAVPPGGGRVYNVGAGAGVSVNEALEAARRITGRPIPVVVRPRHPADPPTLIASAALIERELGWRARVRDVGMMIEHAWRWMREHPRGYPD